MRRVASLSRVARTDDVLCHIVVDTRLRPRIAQAHPRLPLPLIYPPPRHAGYPASLRRPSAVLPAVAKGRESRCQLLAAGVRGYGSPGDNSLHRQPQLYGTNKKPERRK